MFRFFKQLLPIIAVLAIGHVQVYGMQRGYLCDHQEQPEETQAPHCHRTVTGGSTLIPCNDTSDETGHTEKDTEHHAPVVVEAKAAPTNLTEVSIPAFISVQFTEIPIHEWVLMQTLADNEMMSIPLDSKGESPPAAVLVARCMVMLI